MAKTYAAKSVAIYPVATNNNTLGGALFALGDYPKAYAAFTNGLKSAQLVALYENLAQLTVVYGDPKANEQFLLRSTSFFPQNMKIWLYLAIQQYRNGDITNARSSITNAVNYGQVPQEVYDGIINNRPFSFNIDNNKTIFVQLQHT